MSVKRLRIFSALLAAGLSAFLAACDQPEPTSYLIPKEERPADVPPPNPQPVAPADGEMRVLPGMAEAAAEAGGFTYEVPEGWEELPATGIRKATFRIPGASPDSPGAELAVTVFPGDVGGTLANVNRWRGQIGLSPVEASALPELTRPFDISRHGGMIVTLEGETESILGGLVAFHGFTWFFKMQGDPEVVAGQVEEVEAFLASVEIEDDHH